MAGYMNASVRQVRAGMYGKVTYDDRHVSEPVDPELLALAEYLYTLDTASRLEALISIADDYDIPFLEPLVRRLTVKAQVASLREAS